MPKQKKLTDKQRAFVAEYLVDLNATQAAIRAGYSFSDNHSGYYVYFLVDPDTGKIFYVGKGRGRRALMHMANARRGHVDNCEKFKAITRVHASGNEVCVLYFASALTERDAFAIEKEVIGALVKTEITNISMGIATNEEKNAEEAAYYYRQLLPYRVWARGLTEEQKRAVDMLGGPIQCYQAIEDGLYTIAFG